MNLQNPQLSESIQSHPPITEILSANLTVPEVAAYQQVRTENSFNADKYSTSECFNILGDSGYDDQMMSSYSEQCYDYSLQSNSGCQSLNTSTYQVEQSEDEFRPFVQDTRNDAYNYATVMQNTSDYNDFYGNPENQEFANHDFSSYAGHEPRKRRAYESDQTRMRSSSNCQLNPTAVAIMDAWYRKHLDRPYPNKEEKLNMAIAGSITETQVFTIKNVCLLTSLTEISIIYHLLAQVKVNLFPGTLQERFLSITNMNNLFLLVLLPGWLLVRQSAQSK